MANVSIRLETLHANGFDKSEVSDDQILIVGCSQCASIVIQGTACHEHGCPNRPQPAPPEYF